MPRAPPLRRAETFPYAAEGFHPVAQGVAVSEDPADASRSIAAQSLALQAAERSAAVLQPKEAAPTASRLEEIGGRLKARTARDRPITPT